MKTCIIGNSHAGSLLKAYKRLETPPDPAWEFFVVPNGHAGGSGLRAITFDADRRTFCGFPFATTGGDGLLPIDAYGRFVLIGAHPSAADIAAAIDAPGSVAFRAAAIESMCRNAPLAAIAETLHAVTEAPVCILPKAAFPDGTRPAPGAINEVAQRMAAYWHSRGATLIAQPADMLSPDGLTLPDLFINTENTHLNPPAAMRMIHAILAAFG